MPTLALSLAIGSALGGGAIALLARGRPALLEAVRTFSFTAAAAVVGLHLLPEVLGRLGAPALLWVLFGFALPGVLEALARAAGSGLKSRGHSGARISAEVGFVALVAHSLFEGLALEATLGAPGATVDVAFALVAHHVPLTAAVVLPFLDLGGARATVWRVLGVAGAGALGVAVLGQMPGLPAHADGALVTSVGAALAGALLHVVVDEIGPQRFADSKARLLDLGAAAAGFSLVALGLALRSAPGLGTVPLFASTRALGGLVVLLAPALLFGDLLLAWIQSPGGLSRLSPWLGPRAAGLVRVAGPAGLLSAAILFGAQGVWPLLACALPFALAPGPAPAPARADEDLLSAFIARAHQTMPLRLLLLVSAAGLYVSLPPRGAGVPFEVVFAGTAGIALAALLDLPGALAVAAALGASGCPALLALGAVVAGRLLPVLARLVAARDPASRAPQGAAKLALAAALASLALGLLPRGAQAPLARLAEPLWAQLQQSPQGAFSALALLVLLLSSLWSQGARGFFLRLRVLALHKEP